MTPKVKFLPKKPGALPHNSAIQPSTSQTNPKTTSNLSAKTVKQTSQAKKSKAPKLVPFYTVKKNPYLGSAGDATKDGHKNPPESMEDPFSNEQRLKRKSTKMSDFDPPLKKKCDILDCEQCNSVKCSVCTACLNPHWKKRCLNKAKCPRLHPKSQSTANQSDSQSMSTPLVKNIHERLAAMSNLVQKGSWSGFPPPSELSPNDPAVVEDTMTLEVNQQTVPANANHPDGTVPTISAESNPLCDKSISKLVNTDSDVNVNNENLSLVDDQGFNDKETNLSNDIYDEKDAEVHKEQTLQIDKVGQQTNSVKWQCANCSKVFSQFKSFNKHKCEDLKNKIPCVSCSKLVSRKFMPIHVKMHSTVKHSCPHCKRSFVSQDKLSKHVSIHQVKVHTCKDCGTVFKKNSLLVKHMEDSHVNQNEVKLRPEHKCQFCIVEFVNLALLRKHLKHDHGEMASFRCKECPKVYFSSRGLRNHRKEHTEGLASVSNVDNNDNSVVVQPADHSYMFEIQEDITSEDLTSLTVTMGDDIDVTMGDDIDVSVE